MNIVTNSKRVLADVSQLMVTGSVLIDNTDWTHKEFQQLERVVAREGYEIKEQVRSTYLSKLTLVKLPR